MCWPLRSLVLGCGLEGLVERLRPLTGRGQYRRHASQDVVSSPSGCPETPSTIHVFLQRISGAEPSQLRVASHSTLRDLREAVCKLESCELWSFSLLVDGESLWNYPDGDLLSDHGIVDGTSLTLVKKALPMVVTASQDHTAKIWDSSTGECKQTLSGHEGCVNSAVFSADGSRILTASGDRTAKIWDSSTGECTQTLSGHAGAVRSAVFSADESRILTASRDCTAKIWDSSTGECKQTLSGHAGQLRSAAFS